jgi:hypothetical protein
MSKLVLKEIQRRALQKKQSEAAPKFVLEEYCFDKQIKFIRDPSKFKTGVCSRRAGKTVACAADLVDTVQNQVGDVAYITLNRRTAKRIIWKELLKINRDYNLGAHIDNTDLSLTFPNGNTIYVSGAKDSEEIEKFRGVALRKIYIDECQSFRAYIKEFVEDVLENCLTDYDGSLILIGTPGPVPAGYFYDATTAAEGWSHHHWTMHDNPWIQKKSGKTADQIIEERAKRRGISLNDPSIRREYFGEWFKDEDALVYKFNSQKNVTLALPPTSDLHYVFGVDIGFKDADAIAVLGYNFKDQNVYLVEEIVTRKQDITDLVNQLNPLIEKYAPVKMVMDAGALGKKIQEEIRNRHSLPMEAADKNRKNEYIKLLNDDLRTSKFKAIPGTMFEEDCSLVVWDYEDPTKPKISDRYHTDIGDAVLYAWRECKHFIPKDAPKKNNNKNSDKFMEELEAKEAEEMERKMSGEDVEWGISDDDLEFVIGNEGDSDELF